MIVSFRPGARRCEDVFGDLPTLRTARVLLRRVVEDATQDLFEGTSDHEVARGVPRQLPSESSLKEQSTVPTQLHHVKQQLPGITLGRKQ